MIKIRTKGCCWVFFLVKREGGHTVSCGEKINYMQVHVVQVVRAMHHRDDADAGSSDGGGW
jgi:hypothetical protein